MDLKRTLQITRSKAECIQIANHLSEKPDDFKLFFECLQSADVQLSAHTAWVITALTDLHPELLDVRQKELFEVLLKVQNNEALRRNGMRFWAKRPILDTLEGVIYDIGLKYMEGNYSIAVKVQSMYACQKVVFKYPELIEDFSLRVEDLQRKYQKNSAGIASATGRVLKVLSKKRL